MYASPAHTTAVFVVLDQALGQLRLAEGRREARVVGIDMHPSVPSAIARLAEQRYPVALLVPESEQVARAAERVFQATLPGVSAVVPLPLYSGAPGSPLGAELGPRLSAAADTLGVPPERGIFVSADRALRGAAAAHRMTPVPHPALVDPVLRGEPLAFARVTGEREALEAIRGLLPYSLEYRPDGSWSLLAAGAEPAMARALRPRLSIVALPLDVHTEDPLVVRFDPGTVDPSPGLEGVRVLEADELRALVAIPSDRPTDGLGVHGAHGHFELLVPNPDLLRPAPTAAETAEATVAWAARLPVDKLKLRPIEGLDGLLDWPRLWRCPTGAAALQADVDRYSGVVDPGGGPIVSRHSRHADNPRAVELLLADLRAMGYCAYTHSFQHAGRTLKNVIADLPGRGRFRLVPDIRERVRRILLDNPPDPPPLGGSSPPRWAAQLSRVLDLSALADAAGTNGPVLAAKEVSSALQHLPPDELRRRVERIFRLEPWFPWWLRRCPLPGPGAEIVIVGCHLDSTAASDPGYDPLAGAAPGRDDDASGLAATLALARHFAGLKGKLTHTVRFCFFNAEESGLVGSKAYAASMKAGGAPIRAVICMDMIGYNSDANRIFEVHAGYTNPAVRDASVPIAERIAAWAASLGALAPAQIYKGTASCCGGNRDAVDGAIDRSDHGAFHQQGYPAVVVSEDFFANFATEPGADPNPNYHRAADTAIDSAYAADICCAVALAVKELAG